MEKIYEDLRQAAMDLWKSEDLLGEKVQIKARALTVEEAIGNPEADDFPIQKGKEKLMQAEFHGVKGQAFTDRYGDFKGTLDEISIMNLGNNYRRAIFLSSLNASLRYLGRIKGTVHCRDQGPSECAKELDEYIDKKYGGGKILQVGFQPRMAEILSSRDPFRLVDLDPDNIAKNKFGVTIEGPEATEEAINWADILIVTGTTLVNGTIGAFMEGKPILFYGTSIAGAAYLMGWDRFCARST